MSYQTKIEAFSESSSSTPIYLVLSKNWADWLAQQTNALQSWAHLNDWENKSHQSLTMADACGNFQQIVFVLKDESHWLDIGNLPLQLPPGEYHLEGASSDLLPQAFLAWGMGAYQFTRYKSPKRAAAKLVWQQGVDTKEIQHILQAIYYVRDWINTPTIDMNPHHFAALMSEIATLFKASFTEIVGEELLTHNYPCVYHVGKGSSIAPRFLKLQWGKPTHPKVTLVGKGVCFDSGGYDIKPASGMLTMKKDMGGAAIALALAYLIMAQDLPLHLTLLIPAVENTISGSAYLPGDVLTSRSGKTIEIGNTDAEGRLILCDALIAAAEEKPDLLIDFSTLTGAARIAVGMGISAFFSNDEKLATALMAHAKSTDDPCWPLPLFDAYRSQLKSPIADLTNAPSSSYGGAITAALFLEEFVDKNTPWAHFDVSAWNVKSTAAKPEGGEAMALRAVYAYLKTLQ